jgi:DNA-binding NarL/FixJ family response regulator
MESPDTIRVALFEDNKHLRESLFYIINGTPGFECAGAFADCSNLLFQIRQTKPDVVLMDIELPGISGIEGVKMIRKELPAIQILMQTVFSDDDNIFQSIVAGASGYILKTASPTEILQAIKDVYYGGSPMSGNVARRVLSLFQKMAPPAREEDFRLTPREKEILAMLVNGKSYKMIAEAGGITYETVRSHMKNIYEKLHVESMTEAVAKAIHQRLV